MHDARLDAVLLTDPHEISYFSASLLGGPPLAPACLLLRRSGESVLVCGESEETPHVDLALTFPWHTGGTISHELMTRLIDVAAPAFRLEGTRTGIQFESIGSSLLSRLGVGVCEPVDRFVLELERATDPLDLLHLRAAIRANLAALEAAAGAITPGANELEVFAAGARGAMIQAGKKLFHDGDYRCNAPGGSCRNRAIVSGEIYTIDAWTRLNGYWSDLARAFPVGEPTDEQARLHRHVAGIHQRIQPLLRPGVSGDDIWREMDGALRAHPGVSGLSHHGGHGIGLRMHQAPDINPGSTDTLRPGDVICIEPGAYAAHGNFRIEETYLITGDGSDCLSSCPADELPAVTTISPRT